MPRVFLCYKCGDTGSEELITTLKAEVPDVAWFHDREIPAGNDWFRDLGTALHDCHGAVVLLSKAALEACGDPARPWIQTEILVFAYRTKVDPTFRLLPVLVDVTVEEVKKAGLDFLVTGTQLSRRDVKTLADAVGALPSGDTPVDLFVADLVSDLERANDARLQKIAQAANAGGAPLRRLVARKLLDLDLTRAYGAIEQLYECVADPAIRERLRRRVFPFAWIHPGRTRNLPTCGAGALPRVVIAQGTRADFTVAQHLVRARFRLGGAHVIPLTGEPGLAALEAEARRGLADKRLVREGDDLATVLGELEEDGEDVVFVVTLPRLPERLPPLPPWPGACWFFLVAEGDLPEAPDRVVLLPPLPREAEDSAWRRWGRLDSQA